jgi:hypothetical protein
LALPTDLAAWALLDVRPLADALTAEAALTRVALAAGARSDVDGAAATGAASEDELLGAEFAGATAAGSVATGLAAAGSAAFTRSLLELFFVPWNHAHPATPTATSARKSEINPTRAPRFRERNWLSVIVTGSSTSSSALSSHLFLMDRSLQSFVSAPIAKATGIKSRASRRIASHQLVTYQ